MLKPILTLTCATALMIGAFSFTPAKAESFTPEQKKELEKLFQDYLLNNGELVMQSVEKFQTDQQVKRMEDAQEKIRTSGEYLYESGSPSFGPEDADVTVVEFLDYNCGYCKRAFEEIQTVIEEDKKVRVIFKELPILSAESKEASQWALAADKQGKYFEFHSALMNHKGLKNISTYKKIAEDLDLDLKQMEKDKDSQEILAILEKNLEMSRELGIRGTPAFIIGDQFSPGYIPASRIKTMIEESRANKG